MAQTKIRILQGGEKMEVDDGGTIEIADGGNILIKDDGDLEFGDGADVTLSWNGTVLVITGIPTSDPSVAGALWANSNVLTLSAG